MVDDSPNLGYVFIFAAFASIGFPLTSGFVAEFLIMLSVYHSNQYLLLIVPIFGIFITTIYMFRTVKKICLRFVDSNNIKRDLEIDDKTICYILVILMDVKLSMVLFFLFLLKYNHSIHTLKLNLVRMI